MFPYLDQGLYHTLFIFNFLGASYLCWAYSCASMLRASVKILIKKLFEAGKIDDKRKEECLEFIREPTNHQEIRNLIAMVLVPKQLHKNDNSQAAYLRAAVSRVSLEEIILRSLFFLDCKPNCNGKTWRFDVGTCISPTF